MSAQGVFRQYREIGESGQAGIERIDHLPYSMIEGVIMKKKEARSSRLLEMLQHIIRHWIVKSIEELEGKPSSIHEHVPIYDAIKARDSVRARTAMNEHLEKAGWRLQQTAAS